MKKPLVFLAFAVIVVAGARWHYSRGSASMALSPAERQSLHDAPNEDQKAPKVDLRKFGLDSANAAPVAAPSAVSSEAAAPTGDSAVPLKTDDPRSSDLRIGDSVMDANGLIGIITDLFSDGRTVVRYAGDQTRIDQASRLAVSVESLLAEGQQGRLVRKDRVIDSNGLIGTITDLFSAVDSDGSFSGARVVVLYAGGETRINLASRLSKSVESLPAEGLQGQLVRKDRVMDANGLIGIITDLFWDGRVVVLYVGGKTRIDQASTLSKSAN